MKKWIRRMGVLPIVATPMVVTKLVPVYFDSEIKALILTILFAVFCALSITYSIAYWDED